jgi:hypothetical protein
MIGARRRVGRGEEVPVTPGFALLPAQGMEHCPPVVL